MLASIIAAKNGCAVTLFEKNEKLGKKVYITGKGRCNVTNNCDPEELLQAVMSNQKFLYSAFYSFTSQDMMQLLEDAGVPLKTERGNRVFPVSDHSSDIIHGLERLMKKYRVQIHLRSEVKNLLTENGIVTGIQLTDNKVYTADAVIVATGGCLIRLPAQPETDIVLLLRQDIPLQNVCLLLYHLLQKRHIFL